MTIAESIATPQSGKKTIFRGAHNNSAQIAAMLAFYGEAPHLSKTQFSSIDLGQGSNEFHEPNGDRYAQYFRNALIYEIGTDSQIRKSPAFFEASAANIFADWSTLHVGYKHLRQVFKSLIKQQHAITFFTCSHRSISPTHLL